MESQPTTKALIVLVLSLSLCPSISFVDGATNSPKIDLSLRKTLISKSTANVLVSFVDGSTRPILQHLDRQQYISRTQRSQAVYDSLTSHATKSQATVLEIFNSPSLSESFNKFTSLWITNQLGIQGATFELIDQLATMKEVTRIQEEEIESIDKPIDDEGSSVPLTENSKTVQWGVDKVQAPQVWATGNNGSGITVANIDTGVRWTHETLAENYKNDGHSWFDPYNGTSVAADYHGHGSHVIGTIVGTNGYGVAPGAKWIACKGLSDTGSGSSTSLIACGQFLICPTRPNGTDPDCSKTPHVVANSWGGAGGRDIYDDMIAAWHAAGIIPVFSNGNNGPNCNTTGGPGDRDVISVGSTTTTDALSGFSSRGPSYNNTQKPEISAPGQLVQSAGHLSDTVYSTKSGTSMSCPHVAGVIALILNQNDRLAYSEVKNLVQASADRNLTFGGSTCDGVSDDEFPNYHFGHGRVNALKAVQALALQYSES